MLVIQGKFVANETLSETVKSCHILDLEVTLSHVGARALSRATVVVMPTNSAKADDEFAAAFNALGIRANDALVLQYVAANPGQTHRKIGAALGISHTTVRRICSRYEGDGIIFNVEGPNSRKYHLSVPGLLAATERYLGDILSAGTDK